ncbi:MAG: Uma2 family endonuclease [Microcystaceae cyanobacterium]
MVQSPPKPLTLEDFLQLPETKPASEYIDGEIIQKIMPQGKHSLIQSELVTTVNLVAKKQHIAYAFPELRCTFGGRSMVPDVVVLQWERIPRDENGEIANVFADSPDWLIEILSPNQNLLKVTKKVIYSLKYGSELGWLIVPEEHTVFIYHQEKSPECLENDEDVLPVPNFLSDFRLTVGELFGWLKI